MMKRCVATAAVMVAGVCASAQSVNPSVAPPLPGGRDTRPEQKQASLADLPPAQRIGVRAELVRRQRPVAPVVVIVNDFGSYVEAIARWTPTLYYPVLLEDGSTPGREDIARFVRAFKPSKVVRWSAGKSAELPADPAARRGVIEAAVARSWGLTQDRHSTQDMIARCKEVGLVPPGFLVADTNDGAWSAAVALAAGRGQPILWAPTRQGISEILPTSDTDAFCTRLEQFAESTGLSWKELGDDIDAVTICLNMPSKTALVPGGADGPPSRPAVRPGNYAAMTDRVGRFADPADHSKRWAWSSQIFGIERQAAYRAMCALFLNPKSAWLFDGYGPQDKGPFAAYDATKAAEFLTAAGLKTVVDDTPKQSRDDLRARVATPPDAGLILFNSKGQVGSFDVAPGKCVPGDIPMLSTPAVVHMVHSFSLQFIHRDTVGGRWMENGAYAYLGSVDEPSLQAFVQTPMLAGRLVSALAWGAAVRLDNGPMWRLQCFGDPLITLGPDAQRSEAALPLENTADVEAQFKQALKDRSTGAAIRGMVMVGQDEQVCRLFAALAGENKATLDDAVASLFSLARCGRADLAGKAFSLLDDPTAKDPWLIDALWFAAAGQLSATSDKLLLDQLVRALRPAQVARDAADLLPSYKRVFGVVGAKAMLGKAGAAARDAQAKKEVADLADALR